MYKVVVVHDGVRPVVSEQLLIKIISGAAAHGAAGATRPLISTVVKPMSDGFLDSSLDRNAYLLSETPQAFLFQIILNAYQKVRIILSDSDIYMLKVHHILIRFRLY